jgi:prepilin-type processing-associated H-X9-DG protein
MKFDKRCWMHMICPYLEMTDVYDKIMTRVTLNTGWPFYADFARVPYPLFMCPSDSNAGKMSYSGSENRGFRGNYLAAAASSTFGSNGGGTDLDGIFYALSKTKTSEVTDGLSKTLMLAENVVVPEITGVDCRGGYFNAYLMETLVSTYRTPNTSVGDRLHNMQDWPPKAPGNGVWYSQFTRSWHSGGVNVAMADGSTRFVLDTVAADVWTAAGSRNGSEPKGGLD